MPDELIANKPIASNNEALVLICGDRLWSDRRAIKAVIVELKEFYGGGLTIVEGEASGADSIARDEAESLSVSVIKVPAEWSLYGKRAGPIRNKKMLDMSPLLIVAFHDSISSSKGTKDMVTKGIKANIATVVIHHKKP